MVETSDSVDVPVHWMNGCNALLYFFQLLLVFDEENRQAAFEKLGRETVVPVTHSTKMLRTDWLYVTCHLSIEIKIEEAKF